MSLDADAIVDRRRMRRKLTFWRVSALVIVLLAIVGTALVLVPGSRFMPAGAYIARIKIQGLIRGNQDRVEALSRLGRSRARAVIVHIDSPGGTTAGSEQLYDALRELQSKKPMVVVVDGLAASGAYIAALSAEHIVAQETSLVGSVGVLFQYPNFTDVLKTIGIKVEEVKSSPLKAAPNGFEPTSPEARAAIEAIVLDSYAWFKGLVKDRRKMDDGQLTQVHHAERPNQRKRYRHAGNRRRREIPQEQEHHHHNQPDAPTAPGSRPGARPPGSCRPGRCRCRGRPRRSRRRSGGRAPRTGPGWWAY